MDTEITIQRLHDEIRICLISLAEACPVDGCNPEDCPLYLLRKMKCDRRLAWINALEEDDLPYLALYHHVCMDLKLLSKSQAMSDLPSPKALFQPVGDA